jgi:GT2 family glycosyltransferase
MSPPTAIPAFDVAVILVGLNARDFVRACLESLGKARWRACRYEIIYVDNGSTDGTPDMIRTHFPGVHIHVNPTNLGFCPAANQGAAMADARYYYFLNDDTLVQDDAIALLVEAMDAMPDVGTMGSRLLYPDGSEQWSGRRFPSMMNAIFGRRSILTKMFPNASFVKEYLCSRQLNGHDPFEVDWVSAAGQIVRRETFHAVGRFAEDYYYWHEAVFCDRILRRGQRVLLHPRSKVTHFEGSGSGARPFKRQVFHIVDFHRGAFRCYCEHHRLGRLHPMRYAAAVMLGARAAFLLAGARIRTCLPRRSAPSPTGAAA